MARPNVMWRAEMSRPNRQEELELHFRRFPDVPREVIVKEDILRHGLTYAPDTLENCEGYSMFFMDSRRKSYHLYTRLETMPARTRVKPTGQLRHGLAMIAQHPSKGLKEVTYSVTRRDGEVVRRRVVDTRVIRRPKDKVILVGGREARLPSRGGYFSGRRVLNMVASGYPVWVCGTGRTYLGQRARRGIVAVDPRVIPLGARLFVEGYGEAVAGDIGGAIKGNRIDLCFETKREADRYGMQRIRVWILSE